MDVDKALCQQQKIYNRFSHEATHISELLEESYKSCEKSARQWNNLCMFSAIVGLLIFVIGLLIVLVQKDSSGWGMIFASTIPNAISALFFVEARQANKRVDDIQQQLNERLSTLWGMEFIETMDAEDQKVHRSQVVRRLLSISSKEQRLEQEITLKRISKEPVFAG